MTNAEIAAAELLEEYTTLKSSLRELETEHEGLFMQRQELEAAATDKLTEFKTAVKNEGLTYLANAAYVVTAEQTYKKTDIDIAALAKRKPALVKTGIITVEKLPFYKVDKKKLRGAMDAGLLTQSDLDAVTPERTPHAYPVTIKLKEA